MLVGGQVFSLVVDALAASVATWIGARLLREPSEGIARRARVRFAVWWLGLAADIVINAATWALYALGVTSVLVVSILTYLAVAALSVMFWGLLSYVLYLYTGRPGAMRVVTWLYTAVGVGAAVLIWTLEPDGVTLSAWGGAIHYVHEPSGATGLGVAIAFLLPPFLSAIAYASLLPRVKDRARRWRIGLVSGSVVAWFGAALVGAAGASNVFVSLVMSVASILGLILAYAPPAWTRAWGMRRLEDHDLARPEGAIVRDEAHSHRAERERLLLLRLDELV